MYTQIIRVFDVSHVCAWFRTGQLSLVTACLGKSLEATIRKTFFRKRVLQNVHPEEEFAESNCEENTTIDLESCSNKQELATGLNAGHLSTTRKIYSAALPPKERDELNKESASNEKFHATEPTKKRREENCTVSSEGGIGSDSTSQKEILTKNQKRKLKKKRHKDRLREEGNTGGTQAVEFTVQVQEEKTTKLKPVEERVHELLEFFDAIWDVCKVDPRLIDKEASESNISDTDIKACRQFLYSLAGYEHTLETVEKIRQSAIKRDRSHVDMLLEIFTKQLHNDQLENSEVAVKSLKRLLGYWWEDICSLKH